jgi:DNA topoisomerase-1
LTQVRLRRSDQAEPGLTRRRYGRGFAYLDHQGTRVEDVEMLNRIRVLAIPPAWRDVWICRDSRGHLQATGTDAAGRRQYIYHERWRVLRDREKFDQMIEFGRALPRLRRTVTADLADEAQRLSRGRVLATAVRLLDVGLFRIGSHENGDLDTGLGLATIRREHVKLTTDSVRFDFPAKSGVRRTIEIKDAGSYPVVSALRRRRSGPEELLACRTGRRWVHLHADDINEYIKAGLGDRFSAKDFRTWNASVLAAASLAAHASVAGGGPAPSLKRTFTQVCTEVSAALGNTPAVARRSYIDPRLFDLYESGIVAKVPALTPNFSDRDRRRLELAVIELLG